MLDVVPHLISFNPCKNQCCPLIAEDASEGRWRLAGWGASLVSILCSPTSSHLCTEASLASKGTSPVSSYNIILEAQYLKQTEVDLLVKLGGHSPFGLSSASSFPLRDPDTHGLGLKTTTLQHPPGPFVLGLLGGFLWSLSPDFGLAVLT